MLMLYLTLAFAGQALAGWFTGQLLAGWQSLVNQTIDGDVKALYVQGKYDANYRPVLVVSAFPTMGTRVGITLDIGTFDANQFISRVKFDKHEIEEYNVLYSPNLQTMIIVNDDALRFVSKVKKASQVIIELDIYNEGKVSAIFDVRGFDERRIR
jgi:hypothetical protein